MRALALITCLLPSLVLAAPVDIVDTTPSGATIDGDVGPMEYAGGSLGINAGFGGAFGDAFLALDSSDDGHVQVGLSGPAPADYAVLYIDSEAGGFSDLNAFTDASDAHRAMSSGLGAVGFQRAPITFAPGFEADYAIAIGGGLAVVFKLVDGGMHTFQGLVSLAPGSVEFEVPGVWIGATTQGQTFAFVGAYGNVFDGGGLFRSNELHGVQQSTLPASSANPGFDVLTLQSGDLSTFTTFCSDADGDSVCADVDLCDGDDALGDADGDGVCDVVVTCVGDPSFGDSDGDGICDLHLDVPALRPGTAATLTATNARPGALVLFFVSPQGAGNGPCAPAGFGDACLGIRAPIELGRLSADATGMAQLQITVPSSVPAGATASFQAIWGAPGASENSAVVLATVNP